MSPRQIKRLDTTAPSHLEERVEETLDQCRRFEKMAAPLERWATKWSVSTLARWLNLEQLPLEEREKALVALALKGSTAAGIVIDDYRPTGQPEAHKMLYQIVRIEWERRHQHIRRPAA